MSTSPSMPPDQLRSALMAGPFLVAKAPPSLLRQALEGWDITAAPNATVAHQLMVHAAQDSSEHAVERLQILFDRGIIPSAVRDEHGRGLLAHATANTLPWLLDHNCDPIQQPEGLEEACSRYVCAFDGDRDSLREVITVLVGNGADINHRYSRGPVLAQATDAMTVGMDLMRQRELVDLLIELGADIQWRSLMGESLLDRAVPRGWADPCRMGTLAQLLHHGATSSDETQQMRLIDAAVEAGASDVLSELHQRGVDLAAVRLGQPPQHLLDAAIRHDQPSVMVWLLKHNLFTLDELTTVPAEDRFCARALQQMDRRDRALHEVPSEPGTTHSPKV